MSEKYKIQNLSKHALRKLNTRYWGDYLYSSARNYAELESVLEIELL